MSTMKKVISLLLCVAMLFGTVAVVGSVASAEELSGAPLEGTNIDSYESLVAQYGTKVQKSQIKQNGKFVTVDATDGFIYIGAEIVESNGKVTDGLVQPGDELDVRLYVKSNMYTGDGMLFLVFDNKFFDVKLPAGATESIDKNTGYTLNCPTGFINANHPMVKQNNTSHIVTSLPMTGANKLIKEQCGFSTEYLDSHDLIKTVPSYDINNDNAKPYTMTSDEYFVSYKVKVKDNLKEGDTGLIDSPKALWQANILSNGNYDAAKEGYLPARHIMEEDITLDNITGKMSVQMKNKALDYFILEATHTLTIGKPEVAETYTAKFVAEDQTTELAKNEYEAGAKVEFPAAVENQLGWAIVREGATAPGTLIYPAEDGTYDYTVKEADVEFLRVLTTDKFPVKFGIGQTFSVDKETGEKIYSVTVNKDKLPKGMTLIQEEWVIQIDLAIGQPFDLSTIPDDAVVKVGNEITGWDTTNIKAPSTLEGTVVTLNTVNGAMGTDVTVSSNAEWDPELYTVKYYADKAAFDKKADPLKTVEGLLYNAAVSYNGVDAENGKVYNIANENLDKKFAGWIDADTGELLVANDIIKLTYDKDLNLYAKWVDYANSITFMIRDYETGKWVARKPIVFRGDVPEGGNASLGANEVQNAIAAACKDENINFQYLYTTNPDEIKDGNYKDYQVAGVLQVAPGMYSATEIKYTGNVVYYIGTTLDCEVKWQFSAATPTDVQIDKPKTAVHAGAGDPYAAVSKAPNVEAPVGYTLAGWKDAETGEDVTLNENGAYVVKSADRTATLVAAYELVKYPVAFNIQNSNTPDLVMLDGTVTLGGEINIKDAKFTLNGKASALPELGLTNDKQPAGGYTLPEGYKFAGWTLGIGADATKIEFPVKLTADMIRRYYANGAIVINASWEAQEYNLKFFITNAEGNEELYAEYKVKAGEDISKYRTTTPEIIKAINDKAPVGKVFSNIWLNKETNAIDTTLTKMPAKDVAYVASYSTATVKVYLDLNNLADQDLEQTMSVFRVNGSDILLYGDDTSKVIEADPYFNRSFQTVVMRSISNTDTAALIGWNIYHIGANDDVFDVSKWKSGINDEGTAIAETPIIFQAIWLEHKDMLFRVYDTDGKIAHALGKDFKTYFWNNGEIVSSAKEAPINKNKELYLAYILTMSIENWNWSEFFNIEMWQGLTLSFNPFPIPKSWFTWEGFKGLLEAIGNALGSLI